MGTLIKVLDEARNRTCSVVLQQHLLELGHSGGVFFVFAKRRFRNEAAARRAYETARAAAECGGAVEIEILREADDDPNQQS